MGLPIWKPKNEHSQQQQKLQSPPKPTSPHPLQPHYRLYRRQQRATSSRSTSTSYYLASDYHLLQHPLSTEELQHDHHFPPLQAAEEGHDHDDSQQQMERRVNEKQELLDQLNITISLLDRFVAMRDISGEENVDLPPFITHELLAILTATSATLTTLSDHELQQANAIDSFSQGSRLADLESRIVAAHHRVSVRLNLLGAIFPIPSTI